MVLLVLQMWLGSICEGLQFAFGANLRLSGQERDAPRDEVSLDALSQTFDLVSLVPGSNFCNSYCRPGRCRRKIILTQKNKVM